MKASDLIPVGQRYIVKKDEAATEVGGILLPEQHTKNIQPITGTIVATSEEEWPGKLDIGTHILFDTYVGTELNLDGESVFLMDQREVLGFWRSPVVQASPSV